MPEVLWEPRPSSGDFEEVQRLLNRGALVNAALLQSCGETERQIKAISFRALLSAKVNPTMAMPKKGSRLVVVGGVEYRWRVRQKPTYSQANGWSNLVFAVEQTEARGSVLVVETPHPHVSAWLKVVPNAPVTPADVADAIRQGLAMGWQPSQSGKPFVIQQNEATSSA